MEALEQTCARPPNSQAAWIHQIHAVGGVDGSTTIMVVFVVCLCVVVDGLVTSRAHRMSKGTREYFFTVERVK
jgi:hypothetical protein